MKINQIFKSIPFLLLTLFIVSCKKESENIFTMFQSVKVSFQDKGGYSIVENEILDDKDSVHINFTITSDNEDMFRVVIDSTQGNGSIGQREIILNESQRRSYSGVIKHKMARDGKTTFRIYALNEKTYFIGDGDKSITVEGRPSYIHLANRRVYTPGEQLDRKSFYSIGEGNAYDFLAGKARSNSIDFGLYIIPDADLTIPRDCINLYSIASSDNPVPQYDVSDWEKRETRFSLPIKGSATTFIQTLSAGSRIETEAKKANINLLKTNINKRDDALAPGNLVYFLTPEGKYGALYVNQISLDPEGRRYISISTKIQK